MNQSHEIHKTKQKNMVETQYFRDIFMVNLIDGGGGGGSKITKRIQLFLGQCHEVDLQCKFC